MRTYLIFSFFFLNIFSSEIVALVLFAKYVYLISLFPVNLSKLSTLQVLCPLMAKEDRETLIALATAGIINWQEEESEIP